MKSEVKFWGSGLEKSDLIGDIGSRSFYLRKQSSSSSDEIRARDPFLLCFFTTFIQNFWKIFGCIPSSRWVLFFYMLYPPFFWCWGRYIWSIDHIYIHGVLDRSWYVNLIQLNSLLFVVIFVPCNSYSIDVYVQRVWIHFKCSYSNSTCAIMIE